MKAAYSRAAHAVLTEAEIERVFEQFSIVGADIEGDRQTISRWRAGAGGVERELADRDAHAADAEVAQAQNPLAVGDDDEADIFLRPVAE